MHERIKVRVQQDPKVKCLMNKLQKLMEKEIKIDNLRELIYFFFFLVTSAELRPI